MRKLLATLIFVSGTWTHAQASDSLTTDSLYIKVIERYCPMLSYETLEGDTFNRIISYMNKELKFGQWKFFYEGGSKKSAGLVLWKRLDWFAMDIHTNKNGYNPPVKEWRTGKWSYWKEDGESRTDLYSPEETPTTGSYKVYDTNGLLMSEGDFEDHRLMNGKKHIYGADNSLTNTTIYEDGKYIRTD